MKKTKIHSADQQATGNRQQNFLKPTKVALMFSMMLFIFQIARAQVWQSSVYSDNQTGLGSQDVTVTNCDKKPMVNGLCKVIVCDGTNPGLWWNYNGNQSHTSFQNTSNIQSPDVTLLFDPNNTGVAPHALVVYYDGTNDNVYFEDYAWSGSAFVYSSTYDLLSNTGYQRIRNCIHIDGDMGGNFFIIWDDPDQDANYSYKRTIKFIPGYYNYAGGSMVYHTMRYVTGDDDLKWPDVALYQEQYYDTDHSTPSTIANIAYIRPDDHRVLYKKHDLTYLISNNFTGSATTVDDYSGSNYKYVNPRIASVGNLSTSKGNICAICYRREKISPANLWQIRLALVDNGCDMDFNNIPIVSHFVSTEILDAYPLYDPCVTFAGDDDYIVCGFTSEDVSYLTYGKAPIACCYSYNIGSSCANTTTMTLSKFNGSSSNGWVIPNLNYAANGQQAPSLTCKYSDDEVLYVFADPNSYSADMGPDVWYKNVDLVGWSFIQNGLRVLHTSGNTIKIFPSPSAVTEKLKVEMNCDHSTWQCTIVDAKGSIVKDVTVSCAMLEKEINAVLTKSGFYFLKLLDTATGSKENFRIEKL